ncbi:MULTISPECIES: hypothetical protein [Actinomadura]|uniref:Uncharacterized protein n=1 Tax=Actinomadura yumaensis TaxID=111807 RepID=A0ABW2CGA7_9ACTN|nr:hypothetical protein [Actinomadura sp. J1-007]MWK34665.1 hypothetical protein [Actinomadura sp. J1-007]
MTPRVAGLAPPRTALDEAVLSRPAPLLAALRRRVDRFAAGPLFARLKPPRTAEAPRPAPVAGPRLRWHAPAVPFVRAPGLRSSAFPPPAEHRKQRS